MSWQYNLSLHHLRVNGYCCIQCFMLVCCIIVSGITLCYVYVLHFKSFQWIKSNESWYISTNDLRTVNKTKDMSASKTFESFIIRLIIRRVAHDLNLLQLKLKVTIRSSSRKGFPDSRSAPRTSPKTHTYFRAVLVPSSGIRIRQRDGELSSLVIFGSVGVARGRMRRCRRWVW